MANYEKEYIFGALVVMIVFIILWSNCKKEKSPREETYTKNVRCIIDASRRIDITKCFFDACNFQHEGAYSLECAVGAMDCSKKCKDSGNKCLKKCLLEILGEEDLSF